MGVKASKTTKPPPPATAQRQGLGQLTLVEHALCPLDGRVSLAGSLTHKSRYRFTDQTGQRQTAEAQVFAPLGPSANDEFFLWGLLALTSAQTESGGQWQATPHYCLTRLGRITAGSGGGKNDQLFRESIRRLAAVRYQNDHFYDPLRKEHRQVSFGFFGDSLPLDPASSRTWRFVWDPLFYELCRPVGGRFAFDLPLYRSLDGGTRRLFLLLSKLFGRGRSSPRFELRQLGIDGLGFSPELHTRDLKAKLKRCLQTLVARHVIRAPQQAVGVEGLFEKRGRSWYLLAMERGPHFNQRGGQTVSGNAADSPQYEPLRAIGFDDRDARRVLNHYPAGQVQVWSDVTFAALERHGRTFFRKTPQA